MFASFLRVKYLGLKTSRAYLSSGHGYLDSGDGVKVEWEGKEFYFAANVFDGLVSDSCIGLNWHYAQHLGLPNGQFVEVHQVQLPLVNSITIRPYHLLDYDLLVEFPPDKQFRKLHQQVRVINPKQDIIIWTKDVAVMLSVESVKPTAPGELDFVTKLIIKPPEIPAAVEDSSAEPVASTSGVTPTTAATDAPGLDVAEASQDNAIALPSSSNALQCQCANNRPCPLSLKHVAPKLEEKNFEDVGGFYDNKSILVNSILWDVKYLREAELGANTFPIKSGILLYGPPGNGKTLLAQTAAAQFNLRLITVSPYDLLDEFKYKLPSHEAVKDIFERAKLAKPCILFFDDLHHTAFRRGQDPSGVTDGIVNRLLLELDAIDPLTSEMCVMAATTRPDLVDPSLLRPGRLDNHLFCPMPNKDERLEILKVFSAAMNFGTDVDLDEIADVTVGFTAFDLKSIVKTAGLDDWTGEPKEGYISQMNFFDAIQATQPTLSMREVDEFEQIYLEFQAYFHDEEIPPEPAVDGFQLAPESTPFL